MEKSWCIEITTTCLLRSELKFHWTWRDLSAMRKWGVKAGQTNKFYNHILILMLPLRRKSNFHARTKAHSQYHFSNPFPPHRWHCKNRNCSLRVCVYRSPVSSSKSPRVNFATAQWSKLGKRRCFAHVCMPRARKVPLANIYTHSSLGICT